jgi:hypothetical protein
MYYLAAIVLLAFVFLAAPSPTVIPAGPYLVTVTVK